MNLYLVKDEIEYQYILAESFDQAVVKYRQKEKERLEEWAAENPDGFSEDEIADVVLAGIEDPFEVKFISERVII